MRVRVFHYSYKGLHEKEFVVSDDAMFLYYRFMVFNMPTGYAWYHSRRRCARIAINK